MLTAVPLNNETAHPCGRSACFVFITTYTPHDYEPRFWLQSLRIPTHCVTLIMETHIPFCCRFPFLMHQPLCIWHSGSSAYFYCTQNPCHTNLCYQRNFYPLTSSKVQRLAVFCSVERLSAPWTIILHGRKESQALHRNERMEISILEAGRGGKNPSTSTVMLPLKRRINPGEQYC